jgi:hypothetical protein
VHTALSAAKKLATFNVARATVLKAVGIDPTGPLMTARM